MNGHSLKRNRRNLKILLIVGPLLIAGILFVVSRQIYADHRAAVDLLKQSYEDRERLNGLRDDLDELQAGETGFLLTGDQSYLRAHQFSYDDTSVRLAYLNALYADRAAQLERWNRLRPLVEAKLAQYREVTALKKAGQDDKALQLANGDSGTSIIDRIRSTIGEMQLAEDATLTERKRTNEAKLNASDAVSTGLLILSATRGYLCQRVDFKNSATPEHHHHLRLDTEGKFQWQMDANGGIFMAPISGQGFPWHFRGSIRRSHGDGGKKPHGFRKPLEKTDRPEDSARHRRNPLVSAILLMSTKAKQFGTREDLSSRQRQCRNQMHQLPSVRPMVNVRRA